MIAMIFLPPEESKLLKTLEFMCCKIRKRSKKARGGRTCDVAGVIFYVYKK